MSIFNALQHYIVPAYEGTKQNFFTAGEKLATRCLRISNQLSAGVIANQRPEAKINRIALNIVYSIVFLLFFLNLISLAYRITHVSTFAWAFTCTSFLGIPAFIYFALPIILALSTFLISALQLPRAQKNNDQTPIPFSHQISLLCAAIIPFFFPMLFFITLVSAALLLSAYKKIFKGAVSNLHVLRVRGQDPIKPEEIQDETITDKQRKYYVLGSYILLFHTVHVFVGSFPIVAAFSISIVAASLWVGVLTLLTATALLAPQFMYHQQSLTSEELWSACEQPGAVKTTFIPTGPLTPEHPAH